MRFSIITSGIGQQLGQLKELKRNLEAQTRGSIEWLLIDDHVRPELSSSRLRSRNLLVNRQTSIRSQILRKATGKYFIFLDLHAYLKPTALQHLEVVLNFCHNNPALIYDLHFSTRYRQDRCNQYFNYPRLKLGMGTAYHQWLRSRFWLYQYEYEYSDLGSRLRLDGKVLPYGLMVIDLPFFSVGSGLDVNLNFMLQNLERAEGVVQLSQFNGTNLLSKDLTLGSWFKWIKKCFNGLLDLTDQTLIDAFLHYFIVNLDQHFYPVFISNATWRSDQKVRVLIEIQKLLQLINPNSFDIFDDQQHRLPILNRKVLLSIKAGNFSKAEKFMSRLMTIRRYHRFITGKLSNWF